MKPVIAISSLSAIARFHLGEARENLDVPFHVILAGPAAQQKG